MSGNGVDSGTVYALLRELANRMVGVSEQSAKLEHGVAALQRDMIEVKHELARKADKDDAANLRQAVTGYHASVMGHGILISELDERVRRIERRLDMGAAS